MKISSPRQLKDWIKVNGHLLMFKMLTLNTNVKKAKIRT